jgi:ABC-type multidrug transport system ATPase subunit
MIIAENISKHYGKALVLDQVSFRIEVGESAALWGANGAGKTTLIRCLLGVHSFAGSLTIKDLNVLKQGKAARSLIGYVPQESAFFEMSVQETLVFYTKLKKLAVQRIDEVLQIVNLQEHRRKSVHALSGGMKQRLALAVALLANPPILLLDEPTASLDTSAQHDFIEMIRHLNQAGKTIVFSSHRLEELALLAQKVFVLEAGKLAKTCTPEELAVDLGLRQWLRVQVGESNRMDACRVLDESGYTYVLNGKAVYVHIPPRQKMQILRLLEASFPIEDFDFADNHAIPVQEDK